MSDKNHNRAKKLEQRAGSHHDASTRVLSTEDRYGYLCATLLDMAVPEALQRKLRAWQAIQRKQGNTFTAPGPAARERLLRRVGTVSEEEEERLEASMRAKAEATIARYS